jgi:uncharacterized protein
MRLLSALIVAVFSPAILAAATLPAEQPLQAPGPKGPLNGTFQPGSLPSRPVVLIIPGSGPTDRNGNNSFGLKASTYRLLAEGLAKADIASVRIDKRGLSGSGGAVDGNAVIMADYVSDIRSWMKVIRDKTKIPCVWLFGHSEGGLVATLTAQNPMQICGVILVATPGRSFDRVLKEQLNNNPANAPILGDAEKAIDGLKAGRRVDVSAMHPALQQLFAPPIQGYLIDLFGYDPAKLLSATKLPVLIVQGQQDIQVSEQDANLLKAAKPDSKLVTLANVTHTLKMVASADPAMNVATYSNPDLPIAQSVVDAVTQFVTRSPKK